MASEKNKKIEKKMKIIETGFSLFKQNSVSATAIDDVVKAAGIARGTFYLYFKDKSDLLEQIIMYKSTECMRIMLRELFSSESLNELDITDIAEIILGHLIDFLIAHRDMLAVISKNISSCMRMLPDFYDPEIEGFYNRIVGLMEESGYTKTNAAKTIYIVTDMIGSVCSDAIMLRQPFAIEEIRENVISAAIAVLKAGRCVC